MNYQINLRDVRKQKVEKISEKFSGISPDGTELAVTNYYFTLGGKPYFFISGECHYSRVHESQWEDTILKMKMGGINVIATYCFWNHHEEIEGKFRFDGNRNIRKFIELCKKHGMYVIVRIGPFAHGEVRNGGLPDWLYGKPFEVRSLNPGFLACTQKLYHQFGLQFEGLYYKDGGPIIAAQIENEYMHSAAPWEMTTGVSNEWTPGGSDGAEYMRTLKKMAQQEGIITPFYTCTGWGGASAALDEMIPLWGGYAFWPWIFYDYRGEHPKTPEYIYRDNHNNQVRKTYNFEPPYEPESLPYACCEMGGGMACFYHYRFRFPYESIDAMANIKLAGGCNFLGYYMYRGGSNPKGEYTPYLNECQCPKISYDYQAVLGEYGQVRQSYHRLRAMHLFIKNFEQEICNLVTVLPEGSQDIDPADQDTLRYAVRTDGKRGFLFLNNYQDHCECKDKEDESITLHLEDETITIDHISLAAEEETVLPFHLDVAGEDLLYATVQPLSVIKTERKTTYFFFAAEGMEPRYVWNKEKVINVPKEEISAYSFMSNNKEVEIVTLPRKESLKYYEILKNGQKTAILSSLPVLFDGEKLRIENSTGEEMTEILAYPAFELQTITENPPVEKEKTVEIAKSVFRGITLSWKKELLKEQELSFTQCGPTRYTLTLPELSKDCKDVLLKLQYQGDVGQAFLESELISDNFYNGAIWEIGLKEVMDADTDPQMTIYITPRKKDVYVDVSSTMAGRTEQLKESVGILEKAVFQPVYELVLK